MSVAKVIEITAESRESFEAAIREGITRASKTVKNMQSAWVSEQHVRIEKNKIAGYRINLRIVFLLGDKE
jgi:hypothetical protein